MADNDETVVYVSPDGQHEMPLSSPAARINWEARGWTPKGGRPAQSPNKPARGTRREAADE